MWTVVTIYFDSFKIEQISKEIKALIGKKNVIPNIYRVKAHNSIMQGYFCVGFIDFMLKTQTFGRLYKLIFS